MDGRRDTNTGGAEVPWSGIILAGTLETCCTHQNYKKHKQNKYYNWKLWFGAEDLEGRKYIGIIFILIPV